MNALDLLALSLASRAHAGWNTVQGVTGPEWERALLHGQCLFARLGWHNAT